MMCGISKPYSYWTDPKVEKSPIWRTTKDGLHISFYADSYGQSFWGECKGSTPWCRKHCYIRRKPLPKKFRITDKKIPLYNLDWFLKNPVRDFRAATYVTMFASGFFRGCFAAACYWFREKLEQNIMTVLAEGFPQKKFRFFFRTSIDGQENEESRLFCELPRNAIPIFSFDVDTSRRMLDFAFRAPEFRALAVVEHIDNRPLIDEFSAKLPVVTCKDCKDTNYLCFNQPPDQKFLLIMDYQ